MKVYLVMRGYIDDEGYYGDEIVSGFTSLDSACNYIKNYIAPDDAYNIKTDIVNDLPELSWETNDYHCYDNNLFIKSIDLLP